MDIKDEKEIIKEIPKYKVIENYILDGIKSGKLKRGDQIETEIQLSEKFNIGRLTVSKALINLAQEGYIERIPGKGSFVKTNVVVKSIAARRSFSRDMLSAGMKPGSKLIEYKVITGKEVPTIAKYLNLDDEDFIHFFIRLRTGDGDPIALSYTYIPTKIVPAMDINALNNSLAEYLESLGIRNDGAAHKMTAHIPDDTQKELLGINNIALLRNAHVSYTSEKLAFEYVETYYISSKFAYTFNVGCISADTETPFI
ncbi:GntR family transcriptional regulator [Anaeropeptidivorans aminofermentans]|jgi:DNA-binding GntR family transcriptional regulator|uniref:GntR family transcriptional regulator n=1 Tax=Anaeropeptidivorans aminofermentans TaxID=2934315 RepID=UPI0020249A2B|nr:GntR family transcriptional regulator [Anaeropeptidivorans aminofermentans]MBE6011020.1 GntR family transcriptional regulator [Lachnospiraceae bacterium]